MIVSIIPPQLDIHTQVPDEFFKIYSSCFGTIIGFTFKGVGLGLLQIHL